MVDFGKVLTTLQLEQRRLGHAIQAIRKLTGRNSKTTWTNLNKPRRTLSAAARRKISAAQRSRWAKWRQQTKKAA
jgi:hypothetical protein